MRVCVVRERGEGVQASKTQKKRDAGRREGDTGTREGWGQVSRVGGSGGGEEVDGWREGERE